MTILGRVAALRRYPVKSLVGEQLDRAELTDAGIEGDRRWAIFDPEGGVLSARRVPALLEARASLDEHGVRITLPDGVEVHAGEASADAALSAWLGRQVRLGEPTAARPVIADEEGSYEGRAGTFFDASPILLVTTGTLSDLTARSPRSRFDARRFRPNLVIETEGADPVEQSWIGERVAVGSVMLAIAEPCRRCVMTTLPQEDLPLDKQILRAVAREASNIVGVYAAVEGRGHVAVGDAVRMIA